MLGPQTGVPGQLSHLDSKVTYSETRTTRTMGTTDNGKNNNDGKYKNKKLNLITTKEETIAQLIADGERGGQG